MVDYAAALRKLAVKQVVQDLVDKKKLYGRLERQSYGSAIDALSQLGIPITRDTLYQRVKREIDKMIPLFQLIVEEEESETYDPEDPADEAGNHEDPADEADRPRVPGRPKGSTKEKKDADEENYADCVHCITYEFATELAAQKALGRHLPNKFLANLIQQKKQEFGITKEISEQTVRSRVKRKRFNPKHRGVASPLEEAEEALVGICIQLGEVRQPISVKEALKLMNDLIDGTPTADEVAAFQKKRKLGTDSFKYGTVTTGFWAGFLRRNGHRIVSKRGAKFACNRADWTTKDNIAQMYDIIYDAMVDARVAEKLDAPIFLDEGGREVSDEDRFGQLVDTILTKPEYVMFADETGCNTNQKGDGNIAGTKLVVKAGTTPQTMASTSDHRYTLLPFTSATGEAVCCVVIFQSEKEEPCMGWTEGMDIRVVDPVRDEKGKIIVEENRGPGKYFPGGPVCQFNGKTVPCLTFCSESGGITAEILVKILTKFDKMDLFPRVPGGPIPVLLVDGHQTRLDPLFIDYINGQNHRWKVCLGVPYATNLWQVGDAAENNGTFKTNWYRAKEQLLLYKYERNQPRSFRP